MALGADKRLGGPLPVTAVTQQMFQAAIADGEGDADMAATIRVLEKLVGVEVKD